MASQLLHSLATAGRSSNELQGVQRKSSADIMERRRNLERRSSDDAKTSPKDSNDGSTQDNQQVCNASVLKELAAVNKKLDDMVSQIGRCLDDTAHLRKLAQRWPCEAGPPSSHPTQQKQASYSIGPSILQHSTPQPVAEVDHGLTDAEVPEKKVVLNDCLEEKSASEQSGSSSQGIAARDWGSHMSPRSTSSQTPRNSQKKKYRARRHSVVSGNSELVNELYVALSRVRPRSELAKTTWLFLEDPDTVPGGRTVMRMISLAILISAFIPVLQTIQPPPFDVASTTAFEVVLDAVCAIEVVIRFLTCPNRISFCLNAYNLIDIAAGLLVLMLRSLYTSSLVEADADGRSFISTLICAVPVLRLFKLLRRFEKFHLIIRAFRMAMESLPVLLYILAIIVMVFAALIYIVEPRSNVESLPKALWLTIVTVGTVGYGDVVPESSFGSLAVTVLIIVSALYMAIPLGIVGSAFSAVWDDRDRLLLVHRTRSRILDRGFKAQDIPTVFCSFDTDGDGQVTLPEFLSMMEKLQIELGGDRLVQLFSNIDVDDSGAIDDKEFVRTLFPQAFAEIYSKTAVTE